MLALAVAGPIVAANAQSSPRPRVAVVLSGGNAKGFAEVGVLRVLESLHVPIDLVTGTSMGAIIGGLYAMGYSPDDLEHLAVSEDWSSFFARPDNRRDRTIDTKGASERYVITFPLHRARPGLPRGYLSRQGIAEHIERYTWPASGDTDFTRLPTPYAALVTDLATGMPILMQSGSLAQAMEASASLPGIFPPLRLADGRSAVDGAVIRNIPATDARTLGADILICVDVSERIAPVTALRSLVDVVNQTVAFRVQASNAVELPQCTVVITPDISGLPTGAYDRAPEWIARGEAAALARRPQLEAIADSLRRIRGAQPPRAAVGDVDSVYVRAIRWTPVSAGADGIVRGTHELAGDSWLTRRDVEDAVGRLYATGRFDQVSFRLVPRSTLHDLVFDLSEGNRDLLGLGVRYDTPGGVALLADVTMADWISAGSSTSLSARLGTDQQFEISDILGAGPNAHFTQTYRATAARTTLPQFRAPGYTDAPEFDVREISAEVGRRLTRSAAIAVGLAHQWSHDGASGATDEWAPERQSLSTISASLNADTYDRGVAPTHGYAVHWRSEIAAHDRGGSDTYVRHLFDAQGAYSIASGVALVGKLDLDYAGGSDLPQHARFFLGGSVPSAVWDRQFVPFLGLAPQSRVGTAMQALQGGVQIEAPRKIIATVRGNIGNVFADWPGRAHRSQYVSGGGLTLGTTLPPGPVAVTIASRGWRATPIVEFSFGAIF